MCSRSRVLTCCGLLLIGVASLTSVWPHLSKAATQTIPKTFVQFDAVITAHGPRTGSDVVLFARYWVAKDSYCLALAWAEPYFAIPRYPFPPTTAWIESNPAVFQVGHGLYPNHNYTFRKPIGTRTVFYQRYGDYPIETLRFADAEAIAQRVFRSRSFDSNGLTEVKYVLLPSSKDSAPGGIALHPHGEPIEALSLIQGTSNLLKRLSYEYKNGLERKSVSRIRAFLPEHRVTGGLMGDGVTVKLGGKEYRFNEIDTIHHKGGRSCEVVFDASNSLNGSGQSFPSRIEVRNAADNTLLRTAVLSGFRKVSLDASQLKGAIDDFAMYQQHELAYQRLRTKYFGSNRRQISTRDREEARSIIEQASKSLGQPNAHLGSRLKQMNILMDLNGMIGEERDEERCFAQYLSLLSDNGFKSMVLHADAIVAMVAGRESGKDLANALLVTWVNRAVAGIPPEQILEFIGREIQHSNPWLALRLIERCEVQDDLGSGPLKFRVTAAKAIALKRLNDFLHDEKLTGQPEREWVKEAVRDINVERTLADTLASARQLYESEAAKMPGDERMRILLAKTMGEPPHLRQPTLAPPGLRTDGK